MENRIVDIVIIMTIHYSIIIYMIIFAFQELTLNLCNNGELHVYAVCDLYIGIKHTLIKEIRNLRCQRRI